MRNQLDALKRIIAYLRLAREELAADMDRLDAGDLARVIPLDYAREDEVNAYANAAIKRDKLNRGRPEHDMTTDGMSLKGETR